MGRLFDVADLLVEFWHERDEDRFCGKNAGVNATDCTLASIFSFPRISRWLRVQIKVIVTGIGTKLVTRE